MAFRACQVMPMVLLPTEAEGVRAIGELDAVQEIHLHELLDGAIDSGPADARVRAAQSPQELVRGEGGP